MEATNRRKYVVFQFDSSPRPIRSHARVIPPSMTHCFSPNAASHGNPSWPGGLVQACCGTTKAGRILRRFPSNPFFAAAELLDRKSTRLNPVTNAHLVCRLLLEKKKT